MKESEIVIVAGMGRCGTTLLYKHLRMKHDFVRDIANLNNQDFNNYMVIKTHDFAAETLPEGSRVIYLFGDPIDIALSAHNARKVNIEGHYANLHGDFGMKKNFDSQDTLRLEMNFDSWYKKHSYPVLTLRYEKMWNHIDTIKEFVDWEGFHLPEYKPRVRKNTKSWEANIIKMEETYGSLTKKINTAEDAKVWEP